ANAAEVAEVHPNKEGLADNIAVRDKPPKAAVGTIVAIVAHGEILTFRYLAAYPIPGVLAVTHIGKLPNRPDHLPFVLIEQDFVLNFAQFLFVLSDIRHPI